MSIEAARQGWIEKHREMGHHPYPAPTTENPERWDCECGYIWRILTEKQTRQKFAHLKNQKRREPEGCRYGDGTCLTHRRTP